MSKKSLKKTKNIIAKTSKTVPTNHCKFTSEDLKSLIVNCGRFTDDKRQLVSALSKKYADIDPFSDDPKVVELTKDVNENSKAFMQMFSLDTRYHLIGSVDKSELSFALQMCDELEKEFEVSTPSEKALVQVAVTSYIRMFKSTRFYNSSINPEWLSHENAHFLSIYAKEIDRAQRQFMAAIQTLQHNKKPPMNVKINTKNAFIAENQQNISNNSAPHETNDRQ